MSYQRKSEVPRQGEPESHKEAVDKIIRALKPDGWVPEKDSTLRVVLNWTKTDDVSHFRFFNDNYIHSYDVSFTKEHKNGLKSFLIVEVDGLGTRHEKQYQVNRDLTAEDYARFSTAETYRDLNNAIKEYDPNLYEQIMKIVGERHARFNMPDLYFIRLAKEDINEAWTETQILDIIKKKIKDHFK